MTTVITAALSLTCAVLTVALLGALRGIAELRLRLVRAGSGADGSFRLASGRVAPDLLNDALTPRIIGDALVAFLADDCEGCWEVAENLKQLGVAPSNLAIALDVDRGELRQELAPHGWFLPAEVAKSAALELGIDFTPVLIIVRDDAIVGVAYGTSVTSLDELRRFWVSNQHQWPSESAPATARRLHQVSSVGEV